MRPARCGPELLVYACFPSTWPALPASMRPARCGPERVRMRQGFRHLGQLVASMRPARCGPELDPGARIRPVHTGPRFNAAGPMRTGTLRCSSLAEDHADGLLQ